jgi:hypothetical protein
VLGYIAAGVIIGPHTPPFPLIHDKETIDTLAELGVSVVSPPEARAVVRSPALSSGPLLGRVRLVADDSQAHVQPRSSSESSLTRKPRAFASAG